AHRARKKAEKDPVQRLQKEWADNLAGLDEATRTALLEQADTVKILSYEMGLVCLAVNPVRRSPNIGPSKENETIEQYCLRWKLPGLPDELYKEVKEFNQKFPAIRGWIPDAYAYEEGIFERSWFDDPNYKLYGLRTRIWEQDWRMFTKALVKWAAESP